MNNSLSWRIIKHWDENVSAGSRTQVNASFCKKFEVKYGLYKDQYEVSKQVLFRHKYKPKETVKGLENRKTC